ncbi:hypothetical protein CMI47_18730 [Candidatus Pacearchaeota archaeon]|nr:hypothetical protein [Candidatus Pacearchaeota archaeon]|tara:strand:+ start:258 stop:458 length:201 start_codon:yes stop_codon:yes gene_type:complete
MKDDRDNYDPYIIGASLRKGDPTYRLIGIGVKAIGRFFREVPYFFAPTLSSHLELLRRSEREAEEQ